MPASQLSLPGLSPIENRGLFANHFLDKRLPLFPGWNSDTAELNRVFAELQKLYKERGASMSEATNEAQTEDDFVKPVLNALWTRGCYQIQVNLPNPDGRGQPDYALFTTQAARDEAEPLKGGLSYWNEVVVVGDAKKWRDSLDKARKGETPGAQISRYLFQTNRRWGILSNGPIWRLYEQDRARTGGVFYEINLEHILQSGSLEDFKHFYFFFRREAFTPDSSGQSFIEQVLKGSADYATQVGEGLKESVYDALRHLMNGFFDHAANNLDRHDPVQLQRVHDTSLIVLYRLLFILFAEDRGLLPCDDSAYKPISLREMHREINARLRRGTNFLPSTNALWPRVCDLCNLIDGGLSVNARVVIPAYNGGLFSAINHPDIAPEEGPSRRWRIGDEALAETIDRLAYARSKWNEPGEDDIDYSSLEVQNLGSIYEGLLELQPQVAQGDLIEAREGGKTVWKPQSDVPTPRNISGQTPRRLATNEIYLATDKGERKASGSYYTPKYIVDYIVESTVGPLANDAAQKTAVLWGEFKPEHERLQLLLQSSDESARAALETLEHTLLAPYLGLRILDPAMGSGHFLVGAADYLSFAMTTDPSLPNLAMMGNEDAQAFYKRLSVEHCLYGVDLNPLAVELAKLSLWLHTVSKSRALSFLDHHLHTGNSLIGASLDGDLNHEPPRLDARGRVQMLSTRFIPNTQVLNREQLTYFLGVFERIAGVSSGDARDERAKDALYREMDAVRNRYRAVANLWLAPFFGVPVGADFYQRAVQTLSADKATWDALTSDPTWIAAQEIAAQKRFFHWHLEFPEAFLNADGLKSEAERGFDAVIGNPPWGVDFKEAEKRYNQANFAEAIVRMVDSFMFFVYKGKELTKPNGMEGQIVPNPFFLQGDVKKLRQHLLETTSLQSLLNLGDGIFGSDVVAPCCIFILKNGLFEEDQVETLVRVADLTQFEVIEKARLVESGDIEYKELKQSFYIQCHNSTWITKGFSSTEIITRIVSECDKLESWIANDIQRGISADYNDASIVTDANLKLESLEADVCFPVLLGRDVKKYSLNWKDNYVIYLTRSDQIDRYPNVRTHLEGFRKNVTCAEVKDGRHPWFSLHRPREKGIFGPKKFVGLTTTDKLAIALDEDGVMAMDALYVFHLKNAYVESRFFLLAVLNSKLLTFVYRYFAQEEGRTLPQVKATNLSPLPIRRIEFSTPAEERAAALQEAQTLYEDAMKSGDASDLLDWVDAALEDKHSRADCVHDLLAFLAGEMMRLNAAKYTEKNEFFEWLESFVGASIETLSNKTRVRAFDEADFEAFLGVLSANRGRLSKDPQAREPRKSLKDEWTASTVKLAPLRLAITRTDDWIDAVVYKLYRLSESEIAVVRGEAPIGSAAT